jgi:hypothetical protein
VQNTSIWPYFGVPLKDLAKGPSTVPYQRMDIGATMKSHTPQLQYASYTELCAHHAHMHIHTCTAHKCIYKKSIISTIRLLLNKIKFSPYRPFLTHPEPIGDLTVCLPRTAQQNLQRKHGKPCASNRVCNSTELEKQKYLHCALSGEMYR